MMRISKNKIEKITIDKLARITANGFLEADKKINDLRSEVDERFDRVENSITDLRITMDRRLNSMEEKIEKGVDKMLTIADNMTKQFSTWKQENAFGAGIESRQDKELANHEKRIVKIEQKLVL